MNTLSKIINYTSSLKVEIYKATIYSVLNKLFDLAPPLLIGLAVDIVVKKETSFLSNYGLIDPFEQIIALAIITVLVWALESFFEFLFSVKWRKIAQDVQHLLRQDSYSHVQNLDLKYFESKNSGHLISVINDDVNQLERFLNDGANSIIQVIITVISVAAIFFYLAPSVAMFSFLPIPIILIGSFLYQKKLKPLYRQVRHDVGLINEKLVSNFSGISTIKSFTAEEIEKNNVIKLSSEYCKANEKAIIVSSAFVPLIRIAIVLGFVATLVIGGKLTLQGHLEVGVYSVLVFMTQRLLWPLTRLGATFDMYQRSMASAKRIFELLEVPILIQPGSIDEKIKFGEIEFNNVTFSYEKNRAVLNDISFKVNAGETLAIVGSTGSGKSTIIKLLNRFYEVDKGQIFFDKINIKDLTFKSLRSSLSLVSQDHFLFYGSVLENVAYGQKNLQQAKLDKVALESESRDFINLLPNKWDTKIGERGVKLSGGQRQRLTIARALLKDAPVLILDEATSSVDNETEAAIQRAIERVSKTKTLIIIAHRLSTIVNSDKIIVLDKGNIVQRGTHSELVNKNGLYQKLWSVQTGQRENEKINSISK